jgi:hypothetical protein
LTNTNNQAEDAIMYFDRFDIISAHYAFCNDYHSGQSSDLYARSCRIGRYFTPGAMWKGYDSLSENGQEIYNNLVAKHGFNKTNDIQFE